MRRITALLASLALLLTLAPVATLAAPSGGAARDNVIVVFRDSVSRPADVAAELGRQHGLELGFIYQHAFKGFAAAVPAGRLNALQRDPRVAWVEPDRLFTINADPAYETGIARIESDRNTTFGAGGIDGATTAAIAVLDTGVTHSDINVVKRYDCSGGTPFKSSCTEGSGADGHGHGTHVAGTAAAKKNGTGVIGVAPGAPVWSIKVLSDSGSGYTSWIAAGIDLTAAKSGAVAVANMSLGGSGSDDGNCGNSNNDAMHKAICGAVGKGVVYVVAAGNSSDNAANHVPAAYDEVITVSAVADFNGLGGGGAAATCRSDVDDTFADFSNFGADVDIAAPGVCITSTWSDGGLSTISGTSMASPHVAGVAAMYVARNGKPTTKAGALAVRDALINAGFPQADSACGFSGDPDSFAEPLVNADALNVGGTGVACDSSGSGGGTDNPPTVTITSPTNGATVSGNVTVAADATDGRGVNQVQFFVDGTSIGTDTDGINGWSVSWDTKTSTNASHTVRAVATDTADQTGEDSISVTVANSDGGDGGTTFSLALTGDPSTSQGSNWTANVTITARDSSGNLVDDVAVVGKWSNGGTPSCTTGGAGVTGACTVSRSQHKRVSSVTFTVSGATHTTLTYDDGLDEVTVLKP